MIQDYNSEMDIHFPKWRHSITRTRLGLPLPPLGQQSVIISLACWVRAWLGVGGGGGGGGRKWMTNLCFSRNQEFWRGLIHPHLPPLACPLLPIDCTPLSWGVYEWSDRCAPLMLGLTGCIYKCSSLLQPSMSASSSPLHYYFPHYSPFPLLHRPLFPPYLPPNLCGKVLKEEGLAIYQAAH